MTHLLRTIEKSGGLYVWVKNASRGENFLPAKPDVPVEVLTSHRIYNHVVTAVEKECRKHRLHVQSKETRTDGHWRVIDFRLYRDRQILGHWRFREVSQVARAAIIIDDLGQNLAAARRLLHLPYPVTCSVLPLLPHSAEIADEAHRAGREVILHLPMEPLPGSPANPGPGEIKLGMSSIEVARIIREDLATVPHCAGVNNHMGSEATADPVLMAEVMKVLARRRLYFIDSRTTPKSAALRTARRQGLPTFYRSVFLDDTESIAYTLGQLREFCRIVKKQGAAIAIGHPHPTTLAALTKFLPEFNRYNIQLVYASELVHLPEVASLSPGHRTAH